MCTELLRAMLQQPAACTATVHCASSWFVQIDAEVAVAACVHHEACKQADEIAADASTRLQRQATSIQCARGVILQRFPSLHIATQCIHKQSRHTCTRLQAP